MQNKVNIKDGFYLQRNKYLMQDFISSGGFGCTYVGQHVLLNRRICIKEFFVKDFCIRNPKTHRMSVGVKSQRELINKLKAKFMSEARALSEMTHPNIVRVFDVFEENDTAYYVMEYIDGKTISDMLKSDGPMPEQQALFYIRQIADALRYVHAHNRLHMDIKPANIMVDNNGNAILIDFGSSKQIIRDNNGNSTSTIVSHTPAYAPLEQISGRNDYNCSTDIFSLGATLYKMLTGEDPMAASSRAGGEQLAPLPGHISMSTRNAVHAAMQLRQKDRPQSVDEFLQILNSNTIAAEGYDPDDDEIEVISVDTAGTAVDSQSGQFIYDDSYEAQTTQSKKSSTYWWVILLASIVIMALISVGTYYYMTDHKPRTTKVSKTDKNDKNDKGNKGDKQPKTESVIDMRYTNSKNIEGKYTGPIIVVGNRKLPHGRGTFVSQSGTFTGNFDHGIASGNGKFVNGDNWVYEGEWVNDTLPEGRLNLPNRYYFVGTFTDLTPTDGVGYDPGGNKISEFRGGKEYSVNK